MKRTVIRPLPHPPWSEFVREEEAEPECGKHFCDACGDCLDCYGFDGGCTDGGGHTWIITEEAADAESET